MAKASDNEFPSVLFAEQSSDPATPSAGTARLFVNNAATPELELIDDAGTVTTFGAGGGGGTTWLDEVASGNAPSGSSDDEFDGAGGVGTPVGWTKVDAASSATVVWTEGADILSMSSPGESAGHRWHAMLKALPGGASTVKIEAAVRIASYNVGSSDFPTVGIVFTDGTTAGAGKQLASVFNVRSTSTSTNAAGNFAAFSYTNFNTFDATKFDDQLHMQSPWLHIRMEWQGSNTWQSWYSPDGVSWRDPNNSTYSHTMTPTHMGLWSTNNGSGGADFIASWEYFRVTST